MSATEMTEEVAEKIAEATPEFVEAVTGIRTSFAVIAAAFSALGGAAIGFEIARRRLETKYLQIADDEIAVMREHYRLKAQAVEAETAKGDLETLVKERGYGVSEDEVPPMAVPPPASVMGSEDEAAEEAPDDDDPGPQIHNIFEDAKVVHEWNYHEERRRRSPDIPYVIHYDERDEIEGYQGVTLTYYEGDDVLCNERDEIVDPSERDSLVGEKNLGRFGHGSNDAAIVYIRNDKLELIYEVVKSPNTYAEEVHGFSHGGYNRGNLERMRARERDEPEE